MSSNSDRLERMRVIGRLGFCKSTSGSIAIMSAIGMTVVLGATALAVDVASLFVERRHAQGAVDLAAVAAANDLTRARDAALATLRANNITQTDGVVVEVGSYKADPTVAAGQRFVSGGNPANAARVTLAKPGQIYFASVFSQARPTLRVQGTAMNTALADISVGSRLLSVRDGLANALLSKLLGGNVSLSAMDYDALVDADVELLQFMKALATKANLSAGTYNDVLASSVTAGDIISAIAKVTNDGGSSAAKTAMNTLLSQVTGSTLTVPLTSLLDLGPLGDLSTADPVPGLDASYKIMDLINAAAVIAGGKNQVSANLGLNVPGLLSLTLDVVIGEPPQGTSWSAVGEAGIRVRTAQTRVRLVATVAGKGLLAGVAVRLPIYLQIAHAEARLDSVMCSSSGGVDTVEISAVPGVAEAWIGEMSGNMSNFGFAPQLKPANIADAALARVRGSAHILVGNTSWSPLSFSKADIDSARVQTVGTNNVARSLVSSLVGNLNLTVDVLGLGIGLGPAVSTLVAQLLGGVAAPLDAVVVELLDVLGVHVGEADVRVHGAMCNGARLAG